MSQREPILNVPGIVSLLSGAMVAIHAVRLYILSDETDREVLLTFAFIPARFETSIAGTFFPGGVAGDAWSFVTYAFLHADWTHLGLNVLWFLVFGSAVARRFGPLRTLLFFAATAAAGALGHLAAVGTAFVPVIGASGAVSGFTAAALRFVFEMGGPLGAMRVTGEDAYRMPALRLVDMLRNGPVMGMIIVWVIINVAFGAMSLPMPDSRGRSPGRRISPDLPPACCCSGFSTPFRRPSPPDPRCAAHSCRLVSLPVPSDDQRPGDRDLTGGAARRDAPLRNRRRR